MIAITNVSKLLVGILSKFNFEAGDLRLASEVVEAPTHMEVAVHAPAIAVGVPDDPVVHVLLLVVTPSDDVDGVIQGLVAHFSCGFGTGLGD